MNQNAFLAVTTHITAILFQRSSDPPNTDETLDDASVHWQGMGERSDSFKMPYLLHVDFSRCTSVSPNHGKLVA